MIVQCKFDVQTHRTVVGIKITQEELKQLVDGQPVGVEDEHLFCQVIVEER